MMVRKNPLDSSNYSQSIDESNEKQIKNNPQTSQKRDPYTSIRIDPSVRDLLRNYAFKQRMSMKGVVEMAVRKYCQDDDDES